MLRQLAPTLARHLRFAADVNSTAAASACVAQQRGVKTTTNIVGLDFDPNARENLIAACKDVLEAVQGQIPDGVLYRKNLETAVNYKLKVLDANPENGAAEEVLGFQLEQEIQACKKELTLIPKMAEWKPWETDKTEIEDVPYDKIDDAIKKYA